MTYRCLACKSALSETAVVAPKDFEYGVIAKVDANIVRCLHCNSVQQVPFPKDEDLSGYYGDDYQNYVESRSAALNKLNRKYQTWLANDFETKFGKDVRILDFGCGQGAFLDILGRHGFSDLVGFDFVEYPEAKASPHMTLLSSLERLKEYIGQFDVIRMNHVIEHLTNHQEIMPLLSSLLKPNGRLIGETPNPDHYTSRLWGRFWGPLHYPYHTILFSPDGMRRAAPAWQLELVETSGTILPTGWALSMENWLKTRRSNPERGRTKIYVLLMLAFLPIAMLDKLFGWKATANYKFSFRTNIAG